MRTGNSLAHNVVYTFGNFRLNTAERVLESAGQRVSIAPKALELLIALVEKHGRILEKDDLIKKLWPDTFVEDNNLAFNISVLRKILRDGGSQEQYIETVPKRGYRFIADVAELTEITVETRVISGEEAPIAPPGSGAGFRNPWLFAGTIMGLAGLAVAAFRVHPTPKLTEGDTIVVADFLNQTGDRVFEGTLSQGLAIQLEQSPFVTILSEVRIRKTLRLMGQNADAHLTPEMAREVCERTGGAAVLDGSIAILGSRYVLGLRARNCTTGETLHEEQIEASRKEDVLNAVTQLARNFRSRMGESLATVKTHNTPLSEATTPSLDALKAYDAALKVHFTNGARAALPLFKHVVEMDPQFAMAYSYLGRAYANLDETELASESLKRAWQLRDRVSDRERFSIETRYAALVTGNDEATRQTSEAWVRAYPRDPQPRIGMAVYYVATGQFDKAATEGRAAIDIAPDFSAGYTNLAATEVDRGQLTAAQETLTRAAGRGLNTDEFEMLRFDIAFLEGNNAAMERIAARARERAGGDSWISSKQAVVLAYAGHLQQAREMWTRAVNQAENAGQGERAALWLAGAAVIEAWFGNASEAKQRAREALAMSKDRDVEYGAALVFALSGDSTASRALVDDLERWFPEDTSVRISYLPVLRARLALNAGNANQALDVLKTALPTELGVPQSAMHALFGALYPIFVRGDAYLVLRRGSDAADEYRKILEHRGIEVSDPIGALAHLHAGRAWAVAGDRRRAQAAYADFFNLWKDADPDIPVLKDAKVEAAGLNTPSGLSQPIR